MVVFVSSCDLVPCPFSDHCGVSLTVDVPDVIPPGQGLWKRNVSILEDDDYVQLIIYNWSTWRASIPHFPTLAKWWEKGKSLIEGLIIRFCCDRSAARSRNRDLLVRLADNLKAKIDAGSVCCLAPYQGVLSHLANLDSEAASRRRFAPFYSSLFTAGTTTLLFRLLFLVTFHLFVSWPLSVKVFSPLVSVLRLSRVWLGVKPLVLMASR